MTEHPPSSQPASKTEILAAALRMVGGVLTVSLLIVLPALMILGLA